jgi:hypothetical protein
MAARFTQASMIVQMWLTVSHLGNSDLGTEQINQASPPAYINPPGRFSLLHVEQPPSHRLPGRHPRPVAISLDSMIHIQHDCPKSSLGVVSHLTPLLCHHPHPLPLTRQCGLHGGSHFSTGRPKPNRSRSRSLTTIYAPTDNPIGLRPPSLLVGSSLTLYRSRPPIPTLQDAYSKSPIFLSAAPHPKPLHHFDESVGGVAYCQIIGCQSQ